MVGKVLPEKRWGCEGDASAGPRYRESIWSPALPARHVVNDLLTLPLAQRLESFLADGNPGLDADEVLNALEQSH
ncbi:hypothetical protein KBY93_08625 [Synechococcus sp. J7-Johnson]|uniref:hypothetical protein n=1 Tax=Synechococcus sp. J7-Johnson TaxID=2823737 RepID=UPI0020CF5645|nr:hypothetical protein [Synechococcus sp. J7-Johnson]MCP9840701.1 hypothetical protein [Synechococcus sp. J7-Johnson]